MNEINEIIHFSLPIVVFCGVAIVVLLVLIRIIVGSHASRTIKRVRQVEEEVRQKELNIKGQIESHDRELMDRKRKLETELQEMREAAKRETSRMKEQGIAEAKQERAKILDQARQSEEKLKEQYRRQMDEKAVEYGGRIVELVLGGLLDQELDSRFIGEIVGAVEEIEPGTVEADSNEAVVTSARELQPEQAKRLEAALRKAFGDGVTMTTALDETIMGGVVLKLGGMEVDGSLRNRFEEAVDTVIKEAHAG